MQKAAHANAFWKTRSQTQFDESHVQYNATSLLNGSFSTSMYKPGHRRLDNGAHVLTAASNHVTAMTNTNPIPEIAFDHYVCAPN